MHGTCLQPGLRKHAGWKEAKLMMSEYKVSNESNKLIREIMDRLPEKPKKIDIRATLQATIPPWTRLMHKRIEKFHDEATELYKKVWGDGIKAGLIDTLKAKDTEIKQLKEENRRLKSCRSLPEIDMEEAS
jgi:hypothetical protein